MYDPEKVTYFAETDARNKRVKFGIKAKDRARHVYVIGKTGMGKSTLLENMAVQDIQNGEGMAFIDPHGKTADLLLDYVPEHRIKDVIYFAPFDAEYPISFNVMEDVGPDKRHLVANGLMSAFKKIWVDAWSARMEYILNNTILALLEYPDSTLVGVNRMLSDKAYRKLVVSNISDPSVKSFWVDEFEKYGERYMQEAGAAIQNKVGQFISNPLVRNIIGQPKSTFDFREVMDKQKIVIVNLSKGRVGEQNANLIGSMIITKIYLAALSRADISEHTMKGMPNFYLYVDEFQSFANESFADILSEARKYKLNLTMAHQYVEQMSEEVRAAVFGNVGTMMAFRVGAIDAELLEKEFAPAFTAEDMVNLGFVQIYLKLMIDGISSQPFSATTLPPIALAPISYKDQIVTSSRAQFARPRSEVEEVIRVWHESGTKPTEKSFDKKPVFSENRPSGGNFEKKPSSPEVRYTDKKEPERKFPDRKEVKEIKKDKIEAFEAIMQEEKAKENPIVTPKPISLHSLNKPHQSKDKNPSTEHVSELKQALAQLIKKDTGSSSSVPTPPKQTEQQKTQNQTQHSSHQNHTEGNGYKSEVSKKEHGTHTHQSNHTNSQSKQETPPVEKKEPTKKKNEIPEKELMDLLRVDGE